MSRLFDDLYNPRLASDAIEELGIGQAPSEPEPLPAAQRTVDTAATRTARNTLLRAFKVHGAMTFGQLAQRAGLAKDLLEAAFVWAVSVKAITPSSRRTATGAKVWSLAKER